MFVPRVPPEVIACPCDLAELVHRGRRVDSIKTLSSILDDGENLSRAPGRDDLSVQLDSLCTRSTTTSAAIRTNDVFRSMRTHGEPAPRRERRWGR